MLEQRRFGMSAEAVTCDDGQVLHRNDGLAVAAAVFVE